MGIYTVIHSYTQLYTVDLLCIFLLHSCFNYAIFLIVLLVFNSLEFEINYGDADYEETKNKKNSQYSPAFIKSYQEIFNFKPIAKDLITTYPVKYVIVSDPMFQNDLQGFIQWKTKKGFHVWLIPHTLKLTNLSNIKINTVVNIEFDILSKYVKNYIS